MRIPAIDIGPFLDGSGRAAVAERIARACEEIGFLTVTGHGIAPEVIERAFERSRAFFDLPRARKDRCHPTGPSRQRGYHGFATRGLAYTLGEKAPPDLRESYFLGPVDDHRERFRSHPDAADAYAPNIYPDEPEGTAEALVAIYRAYERLAARLLHAFAVALAQPEDFFAGAIGRHFCILSSHHYPPLRPPPPPGGGLSRPAPRGAPSPPSRPTTPRRSARRPPRGSFAPARTPTTAPSRSSR